MALSGSGGALQILEELDKLSNCAAMKEGRAISEEISLLRKQIGRLRERKEQLLSKNRKQKILCDNFTEKPIPLTPGVTDSHPEKRRLLEKECEMKNLQALVAACRLTGLSCEAVKGDKKSNLLMRWDPSYRGHFHETYFAQIQMLPDCKIVHHTLPVFVPIGELERDLKSSVAEFGMSVRRYLQAFVARRDITLELKESIPPENLEAEVHTTAAANCIQLELFNLQGALSSVVILLIFDNLASFHVSRVHVKNRGSSTEEGEEELTSLKEKLLNGDVVQCMQAFLNGAL